MERLHYAVDQIVRLKKPHPCGSYEWTITRTGIDFGIRCGGCGRRVLMSRRDFERAVKTVVATESAEGDCTLQR